MPVISVSLQLLKRTERRREGFLGPWDFKGITQECPKYETGSYEVHPQSVRGWGG